MNYPPNVTDAVRTAVERNAASVDDCIDEAERMIRGLPEFSDLVSQLVRTAVSSLVYDMRHAINTQIRNEAGRCGLPKVTPANSTSVNSVASRFLYNIGGSVLGCITGDQLTVIAANEEGKAAGHLFNARLCRRLADVVPEGKRVQDALSKRKLDAIWDAIEAEVETIAA